MNKTLLTLFVLFSTFYAIAITSYSLDKDYYSPGDQGVLTLTVVFSYPTSSSERLLSFQDVSLILSGLYTSSSSLGEYSEGTATFNIPFNVEEDVGEGIFPLYARVVGTARIETQGQIKLKSQSVKIVVPVKVVRLPKFYASLSSYSLKSSDEVSITICNKGGIAREIELSLEEPFSFSTGKHYLSSLPSNSCKNFTAKIETDASGRQKLVFDILYKDSIGEQRQTSLSIPVIVSKTSSTLSLSHKNVSHSSQESEMILEIKNKGYKPVEDIRLYPVQGLSIVGESELYIPYLAPHSSKVVKHLVYTSLSPGIRNVRFYVTWKEEGEEKREEIELPLSISSNESLEVYLEADPSPLTAFKETTLSVIVANKAGYDVSALSVAIESDAFDILEVQNEKFIGSLQEDDFSSEQFKILPYKSGKIRVTLHYKDPAGNVVEETKTMNVKVTYRLEGSTIITILVILAFLYLYKKRKAIALFFRKIKAKLLE